LARKKGGLREWLTLECSVCGRRHYRTVRRSKDSPKLDKLKKYCSTCRKHVEHKEKRK